MMVTASRVAGVAAYTPDVDAHGAQIDRWSNPVDVAVYGWAPAEETAAFEQGRNPQRRAVDIYAPPGTPGSHRSRWTLNGVDWEQVGQAKDYTTGPFPNPPNFTPGVVIRVFRQEA